MDHKKSHSRRSKRQSKITEESHWDCSVCTYRNSAEAFKCMMCDVRKGTSTRKPRINPQLVAQQVAQQYTQVLPKGKKESSGRSESSTAGSVGGVAVKDNISATGNSAGNASEAKTVHSKEAKASEKKNTSLTSTTSSSSESRPPRKARPKLKNVDRSSAEHKAVTVNNVTVIITEFQPKRTHNGPPSLASTEGSGIRTVTSMTTTTTGASITTNGGGGVVGNKMENGIHSDSTNHSRDSHSDGRSS